MIVVATDRERFWAFALYLLLLGAVAVAARIPLKLLLRRMVVEVPFVIFAVALPFLSQGERMTVFGVSMSADGLLAAWNIVAKATLGVIGSILLAATTEPRTLLLGAQRLRLPQLLVQIASFMLRYVEVILDEMRRMRIARESRAFVARDLRHLPVVARSAGALFIRSYERGERVHLAMLSRGYTGTMPIIHDVHGSASQWALAATLPAAAITILIGGLW
jgi:cobalt/nickel transport system permease protein